MHAREPEGEPHTNQSAAANRCPQIALLPSSRLGTLHGQHGCSDIRSLIGKPEGVMFVTGIMMFLMGIIMFLMRIIMFLMEIIGFLVGIMMCLMGIIMFLMGITCSLWEK